MTANAGPFAVSPLQVGIINVTGYAGAEVARLLHSHPHARVAAVTGRSAAGKRLPQVFPHLWPLDLPVLERLPDTGIDLVVSALPPAAAAEQLLPYIDAGVPVIDISADFRFRNLADFEATYQARHPAPHLLERAVYGIPELRRDAIAGAKLVAVPGCHATGVILALAPLWAAGAIEPDVIADTKTGLSGAGRALDLKMHFSEADESVMPYGLDGHRHRPEIVQELAALAENLPPRVTFVPHYIPMTRGILSTCYARAKPRASLTRESLRDMYRAYYAAAPFVRVVDAPPGTKQVMGTNYCFVHPTIDPEGTVVVASALDNLGKGAAGAVVQCMNLMMGLPETAGLESLGLFP